MGDKRSIEKAHYSEKCRRKKHHQNQDQKHLERQKRYSSALPLATTVAYAVKKLLLLKEEFACGKDGKIVF